MASLQSQILEIADRLDSIQRRGEVPLYQIPPFDYEPGVPTVDNIKVVGTTQKVGVTHFALSWSGQSDPNVDHYEVWGENVSFGNSRPFKIGSDVTDGPAIGQVTSDEDVTIVLKVRTVMKNGLGTTLEQSPSATIAITQNPIGAADIADESIGDAKLDRTTDPIAIGTVDIVNAAITNAKIANLAVDTAKIANATISTAKIQNAAITNALIANLAVDNAKINTVSVDKLIAGNLGVLFDIVAGGSIRAISGSNTATMDGAGGFVHDNSSLGRTVTIDDGTVLVELGTTNDCTIVGGSIALNAGASSDPHVNIDANVASGGGTIALRRSTGTTVLTLDGGDSLNLGQSGSGYISVESSTSVDRVELGVDSSGDGRIDINGTQVIGAQGATVSDPTGGATVDTEARTAINAIIDRLQAHGLIA